MTSMDSERLSPEDRRNGWTEEKLKRYLAERDASVNTQHGLAGMQPEKQPVRVQSSQDYDPFNF